MNDSSSGGVLDVLTGKESVKISHIVDFNVGAFVKLVLVLLAAGIIFKAVTKKKA